MPLQFDAEAQQPPKNGLLLLQALILGLFCVFTLRLWFLQVHKGEEFADKARDNRLRQETVYAPRGLVRDREGRLLAFNEPAYALAVVREDVVDMDATLGQIAQWTGIPREELDQSYERGKRLVRPFQRLILVPSISFELVARIEAGVLSWPGLEIVVRPRRNYPLGPMLSHVLGYVAEAGEEELAKDDRLQLGDTVGKQGVEFALEDRLRGIKGLRQIEVDAVGRRMSEREVESPAAGKDLSLSIDLDLQRLAWEELSRDGLAGAVVVMEPFTGQVLALVSTPSYDNNAFTAGLSRKQWDELRKNPQHPLQNKTTQGLYPPGSVFKLVVAGAGLSDHMLNPRETVFCAGQIQVGPRIFRCWKKTGHGHMDLDHALIESCDVYFYEMGMRLGVDRIESFAKACGFGQKTSVDLPSEQPGLVPSKDWKRRRFGEPWQFGENLNLAIGQGFTLVQPLQVARFISTLVNGGTLVKPTLIAGEPPLVQGQIPLSRAWIDEIRDTMRTTVDSDRGTAKRLRTQGAVIGGKTGTAQMVGLKKEDRGKKTEDIPYELRDHAWIASWGIKDGRSVVIVCMIEHGGHGGETAVPVAKRLYDRIFTERPASGSDFVNWPALPQGFVLRSADTKEEPQPARGGKATKPGPKLDRTSAPAPRAREEG